ncbi:L-rhamnose mutarotase [Streptomyces sp. NPDC091281]|uniref:L-rhamnose mutarotase n=1 Tax=Streptomyces sp. NPDC091281 TaxID=3365985 RepID=UPI003811B028
MSDVNGGIGAGQTGGTGADENGPHPAEAVADGGDAVPDGADAAPGAAPALPARPVERRAAVIRLRPEKEAAYLALHADAWPGVLDALRRAHIGNYSIFLRDGLLFSYLEYSGSDWAADSAAIAADPVSRAWWALTDPCQQPLDSAAPGEGWAPAREVFHLP